MKPQIKVLFIVIILTIASITLIWKGVEGEFNPIPVPSQLPQPIASISITPNSTPILGVSEETVSTGSAPLEPKNQFVVSKVVDGDTVQIQLDSQTQSVRLIGINTPETVDPRRPVECFGKEASNELKKLLEGKSVILEKDVSETDRYGRLLRFVYLPLANGELLFVNDYLVREGFAYASTYPPDVLMSQQFKSAQEHAQSQKKGLWGSCKS
jgi:endonuclease YncB( thermonuclease family)